MNEPHEPLIERAVHGDEDALSLLLEQTGEALHAEVERSIGPQYRGLFDADDILQVTCLEAFLRIRSFTPTGPAAFTAWLRRIADNNLRDAIKELERDKRPSPGRRATVPATLDESYVALFDRLAATTTTASRVCAREELRQGVDSALRQLPADYEQVIRLYELDGLTGPEVAERMGRAHGAIRMLLARARERLAELIGSDTRFFSGA